MFLRSFAWWIFFTILSEIQKNNTKFLRRTSLFTIKISQDLKFWIAYFYEKDYCASYRLFVKYSPFKKENTLNWKTLSLVIPVDSLIYLTILLNSCFHGCVLWCGETNWQLVASNVDRNGEFLAVGKEEKSFLFKMDFNKLGFIFLLKWLFFFCN